MKEKKGEEERARRKKGCKRKKNKGFILASLRVLAERKTAGLKLSPKGDFRRPYWWTPYKALQNVSANNSETVGNKDLRFGEIV